MSFKEYASKEFVQNNLPTVNGVKPDKNGNVNVVAWEKSYDAQTITYNGTLDGYEYVSNLSAVKILDSAISSSEIIGSTAVVNVNGTKTTYTISQDMINEIGLIYLVVLDQDNECGLYVVSTEYE